MPYGKKALIVGNGVFLSSPNAIFGSWLDSTPSLRSADLAIYHRQKYSWRRAHRSLLSILFVGFALRIAAIWQIGFQHIEFGDASDYVEMARCLCETGDYPEKGNLPFFRAPGLPFFIAATTLCATRAVGMVKIALALIDCLTIAVVYAFAVLLWNQRTMTLSASLIAAVYPIFVVQITDLRTEPLFMFFLTSSLFLFVKGMSEEGWSSLFISGLSLGLASLTRPVALILIGFFILAIFCVQVTLPRRRYIRMAAFALGSMLTLLPWVAFNYNKYGEIILVNDAAGYAFWRETNPEVYALCQVKDRAQFAWAARQFESSTSPRFAAEVAAKSKTPLGRSKQWYALGMRNIRRSPHDYGRHLLHKAVTYWRPWLNPQVHSTETVLLSGILFSTVYMLAAVGLFVLSHQNRSRAMLFIGYFLLPWIAQVPFQVVLRFRVPFTDPLMVILAAHTLVDMHSRIGSIRKSPS